MDAALAGIVGAAVGAAGTAAAGAIAALSSRAQARLQLRAEHVRLIREPRKQAYVAYAEACQTEFDRLSKIGQHLEILQSRDSEDERAERRESAVALYDASTAAQGSLKHLQAQVHIEGPRSVINAAIDLSGKLGDFKHRLLDVIHPELQTGEVDDTSEKIKAARDTAYRAYLKFLYRSSDAIGEDGIDGETS
ncbi:hypothetical protein [Streptomyces sp. WMMB 714]|uniref:hypothetical protein n=1 Tax=Streptomyces sp. WMMB 714 TaxID=1286822 RepID=UPI001112E94A|nr:hypothetical protein [Streptomyces sp. WMMB 714]